MSEESGIDLMRARMQRGRRQPPSPRRAGVEEEETDTRESPTPVTPAPVVAVAESAPAVPEASPVSDNASVAAAPQRSRREAPLRLSPSLPWSNLAIRVRRPLDDRLADLIHELRRDGVRTSKVEVIEMLLWELPPDDAEGLRKRIARFRRHAPRSSAADLEG